jgi:hypothetical protein
MRSALIPINTLLYVLYVCVCVCESVYSLLMTIVYNNIMHITCQVLITVYIDSKAIVDVMHHVHVSQLLRNIQCIIVHNYKWHPISNRWQFSQTFPLNVYSNILVYEGGTKILVIVLPIDTYYAYWESKNV